MARLTPILLFTTVFNASLIMVTSWGPIALGLTGKAQIVSNSPIYVSGSPGAIPSWAAAWISNPALLIASAASLLSVMLVFGNFFGALVTYLLLFTTNMVIPSILLYSFGVPLTAIAIIASALWFSWLIEILQIQSGRYLND
jgi:hypothetical protein